MIRQTRSDSGVQKFTDAELIDRNSQPEPNSGCWLWLGHVNSWGYGRLGRGRLERQAHRLSYLTYKGPIPSDLLVLHSCDMPCCVNPDHLRLGTHADNNQDTLVRDRHVTISGEQQHSSKLTWDAVAEIRSSSETISELARRFGVSRRAIRFVKDGKTWQQ
jgi:anaerobic selenocysteine-containing dehydrogenase